MKLIRPAERRAHGAFPLASGCFLLVLLAAPAASQAAPGGSSAMGPRLHPGPKPVPAPTIVRVNTSSGGLQANGPTDVSAVSADGRIVADEALVDTRSTDEAGS